MSAKSFLRGFGGPASWASRSFRARIARRHASLQPSSRCMRPNAARSLASRMDRLPFLPAASLTKHPSPIVMPCHCGSRYTKKVSRSRSFLVKCAAMSSSPGDPTGTNALLSNERVNSTGGSASIMDKAGRGCRRRADLGLLNGEQYMVDLTVGSGSNGANAERCSRRWRRRFCDELESRNA
ncbi:hypothetical protein PBRA_002517 [Plasmodiophora brassicae]|uniref:Uncharacterized protein n=1 Tax=Plasmodiophora brassicae TaxID=37360 RepID=A0A0G4J426_PLABS|nr:hypothetical protein PBRA_002517 [Plasmodiophora brassicae]